jgi:hypothetical protein
MHTNGHGGDSSFLQFAMSRSGTGCRLLVFGPVIVNPKAINRITDLDARADIELSWPHETARRHDFEFQKAEAGIRARRCAN